MVNNCFVNSDNATWNPQTREIWFVGQISLKALPLMRIMIKGGKGTLQSPQLVPSLCLNAKTAKHLHKYRKSNIIYFFFICTLQLPLERKCYKKKNDCWAHHTLAGLGHTFRTTFRNIHHDVFRPNASRLNTFPHFHNGANRWEQQVTDWLPCVWYHAWWCWATA